MHQPLRQPLQLAVTPLVQTDTTIVGVRGRGHYPDGGGGGGTLYGAQKAAMERFTQGLASEVYQHGVSVSCFSPSLIVATPGVEHHRLIQSEEQPQEWCGPARL